MFTKSGPAEAEMLQRALVAVIEHVEDASWLQETLVAMGKKHVDYGVTFAMYDWVVSCLRRIAAQAAPATAVTAVHETTRVHRCLRSRRGRASTWLSPWLALALQPGSRHVSA